jgi:uncharacterized protein (DUF2147 family)
MLKLSLLLFGLLSSFITKANDGIIGIWMCSSGKAKVEIYKVQDKFFGRIINLKEPTNKYGALKSDIKNPDKKQQSKPIVGLVVLRDLLYSKEYNYWKDGSIYNPDDGRNYKCIIKLTDKDTMEVRGFVGFACFGKTQTLHRVTQ